MEYQKAPLFVFTLLFALNAFCQDTIHWRSYPRLSWDDFQGKPETNLMYGSVTFAGIRYAYHSTDSSLVVKVYCYFDKRLSWVYERSDAALDHEQGHFDIAELFARKLRQSFNNYIYNPKSVAGDLYRLFKEVIRERKYIDDSYDLQTDFSRDKKMQKYWNKKIGLALNRLKRFKTVDSQSFSPVR